MNLVIDGLRKHTIFKKIASAFIREHRRSYAQCGEDMILDVIVNKKKGFYIDIGANNPVHQSNTMYFYKKGWNGINIDATPGSMRKFRKKRKRDLNLEAAIASEQRILTFNIFMSSFYNTFILPVGNAAIKPVATRQIETTTLSDILDKYLRTNEIDFLSVDTEGFDLEVLKSNTWERYRPKVILTEFMSYSDDGSFSKTRSFLESQGYQFFCSSPTNAFFLENEFYKQRFWTNSNSRLR